MRTCYIQKSNYLLIVFFLFTITFAYSQTELNVLKKAYKNQSTEELKNFFDAWSREISPITDVELLTYNDTIQQAYKAFIAFYKPHRLDSLGGSEWGNDIYKNVDFLIVQNKLKIYFTDKIYYTEQEKEEFVINEINRIFSDSASKRLTWLERDENGKLSSRAFEYFGIDNRVILKEEKLTDSIMNFRPSVNCNGKLPLFLTKKYDKILNDFLENEHWKLGTGGLMNPARSKGKSAKRKDFLENYIKIFYGHWGGYWQLYSYPQTYSITFDKDMKYAKINFRIVYEGGYAILKREGEKWTLISSELIWIE